MGSEFEIVEKLRAHEEPWITLPEEDIQRGQTESPSDHCLTVEAEINNGFLQNNVHILLPPDCSTEELGDILTKNLDNILPCILYCICSDVLSDNVSQLF